MTYDDYQLDIIFVKLNLKEISWNILKLRNIYQKLSVIAPSSHDFADDPGLGPMIFSIDDSMRFGMIFIWVFP